MCALCNMNIIQFCLLSSPFLSNESFSFNQCRLHITTVCSAVCTSSACCSVYSCSHLGRPQTSTSLEDCLCLGPAWSSLYIVCHQSSPLFTV